VPDRAEAVVVAPVLGDRGDVVAALGEPEAGRIAIDLAVIDARPADATATDRLLALEGRDGRPMSLSAALASITAKWMVGRRYIRRD